MAELTYTSPREDVVALMESSQNETEWNDNCDAVKRAFGGYPNWWYEAIMMSGVGHRVQQSWIGTAMKGNLDEFKTEDDTIKTIELLPPTPLEIELIRKAQQRKDEIRNKMENK